MLLGLFTFAQESGLYSSLKFRNVGPTRGGRSTTVTGVVQSPGTFYMGTTGGGLWKTTDYGINWKNISDGYFSTGSIGAVRVAPSDQEIIYSGTGSDGIRSNIIVGKGVYKSSDAGKTWEHIGLEETGHIGAVEIHPENPDVVFVAAIGQAHAPNKERGLFRSTDGGESWQKVLYIADTIGIVDFEFNPDNPNEMYASAWQVDRKPWTIKSGPYGGIWKSIDGGNNWFKLTSGLPSKVIGKIDLAVTPANPDVLYALVEAPEGDGGLYRSNDRGASFELMSADRGILDRPFYYCNVDVNPLDEETVFVNSTRFYRSFNGGKDWKTMRTPHGDNHDIWIHPTDTSLWVQANDGGGNVTLNNGESWSVQSNQPTAELYQVEVDDQYPYWLYAGQQDNSTISVPSNPPFNSPAGPNGYWMSVGGCETGPAVPKPGDPNTVYSNCKGRFGVYNKITGQESQYYVGASNMYGHNPKDLKFRFQRVSPIHVSPHNPEVVYHTSQYVHRTLDDGKTWEIISPDLTAFDPETQVISGNPITRDVTGEEFHSTIYAIRESPISKGVIWVGSNDGPVHVTYDNGKTWTDVTPEGIGPYGRVDSVEPSPHDENKAFVTVLRYQLGDWKPYIFKTNDKGESWELITNGIPDDYPVRVVREDPETEGLLFAGTEFGLYHSHDDGEEWSAFQQNLPVTPITDIKIFRNDLILSTMGRSFWIMDDISVLRKVNKEPDQVTLLNPEDAIMYRYRSRNSTPSYSTPGVNIDYYLKDSINSELTINILSSDGAIINSFTSKAGDRSSPRSTSMATGFSFGGSSPSPGTNPGFNRFQWTFNHVGPWHENESRSGLGGPRVSPGDYKVQLNVDGKLFDSEVRISPDPRLKYAGITVQDLKAQEELNLKIRDLQSKVRYMNGKLEEMKSEYEEKKRKPRKGFEELYYEINSREGRYMVPKLEAQINYLASMLRRADQLPGKDAYDRFDELSTKLNSLIPEWERLTKEKMDDIPLNLSNK